jgi:hypothetical protein
VTEVDPGQPGRVGGAVDERDVKLGVRGGEGEDRGRIVAEPDGDAGVGAVEGRQQARQVDHAEGLDRPDVQLAAQHAPDAGDGVAAVVGGGEGPARGRQQRTAGLGQRHAPAVPHEQTDFGNDARTGITSQSWRNRSQPRPRLL